MVRRLSTTAVALAMVHVATAHPSSKLARSDTSPSTFYEPTWESTDKHPAAPEWFKDAKLGVYWHWGAFSTPQFGSEWYPRNMYRTEGEGTDVHAHHVETYGDPDTVFPYDKFINGGTDLKDNHVQFKPVLKSEGGQFDPESWMAAIKASGARFAGPVAEHHDGYSLWNSSVNSWNSARLGPQIDLVEMFAKLVRDNDMKLMIAMHTAFNVNGFFSAAPNQTDPELRRLYGQWDSHEDASDYWLAKQLEAMNHVQPDMIWNDWALWEKPGTCDPQDSLICGIYEPQRLEFLAKYFNAGLEWGKDILTTYKHTDQGFRNTSAIADWERGGPADLVRPYWLTDDAISASSWSYTDGIKYYSSKEMIHSLLDRVSKNGNMLLNVSPTAAGVLPAEQEAVLRDLGAYMDRYSESVYSTRAWDIYGEGPNTAGGGAFTKPLQGNSSDIRFVTTQDRKVLYATLLGWPESGSTKIASLGADRQVDLSCLEKVQLFGNNAGEFFDITVFKQEADGLVITTPDEKPFEAYGYVLKLTFADRIPVPQPEQGATVWPASGGNKGITLGLGDFWAVFLAEAGIEASSIGAIRVSPGTLVSVFASKDATGTATAIFDSEGEHKVDAGSVGSLRVVTK